MFVPLIAYAQSNDVTVSITDPAGDPVNPWGLEVKVFQGNDPNPEMAFEKPSNPQKISLDSGKDYKITVYRHNMYVGDFFIRPSTSQQINIQIPDMGGIRFDVLYSDSKPIKGAKVEIFSQLGVKWAEGITNDDGRTERFWIQSPVKTNESYHAKITIGDGVSYEISNLRPGPGFNDLIINTPWKSIVDDLIRVKLFHDVGKPVTKYDGDFLVELYDVHNNKIKTEKITPNGEANFSNLSTGNYFFRVVKTSEEPTSTFQVWAIKKVFITKNMNEIKIFGLSNASKIEDSFDDTKTSALDTPDETCNCVAFRLDNVQDFYLTDVQKGIIDLFVEKNAPLTLGIIGQNIGSDVGHIDYLRERIQNHNDIITIGNHGGIYDITTLKRNEQYDLIKETDDKILRLLGAKPSVFIPPFGTYNGDTVYALEKEKIKYVSSVSSFDKAPYKFHDVSLFRFPSTTATGYIEQGKAWYGISTNQTMNDIKYSLRDYGYAVVLLHPHEYSKRSGWNFENQLDVNQFSDLNVLIDLVRINGLNIVPIDKIDVEAQHFSSSHIPFWLKNTVKWWSEDKIPDSDLLNTLEYLLRNKILKVSIASSDQIHYNNVIIPSWLKNNSKLWAEDKISDKEFLNGVEFLINQGIIKVR